jgi:hypothetical protein
MRRSRRSARSSPSTRLRLSVVLLRRHQMDSFGGRPRGWSFVGWPIVSVGVLWCGSRCVARSAERGRGRSRCRAAVRTVATGSRGDPSRAGSGEADGGGPHRRVDRRVGLGDRRSGARLARQEALRAIRRVDAVLASVCGGSSSGGWFPLSGNRCLCGGGWSSEEG